MFFEGLGDRLCMLGVLFGDECQVADLISIVHLEVLERLPKIVCNFSGGCSRERTSRRSGRHDDDFDKTIDALHNADGDYLVELVPR